MAKGKSVSRSGYSKLSAVTPVQSVSGTRETIVPGGSFMRSGAAVTVVVKAAIGADYCIVLADLRFYIRVVRNRAARYDYRSHCSRAVIRVEISNAAAIARKITPTV